MDFFTSSIDLMRIVFLLGAVLALVYKKKFGATPGGIIVPGTLAGILFSSFTAFLLVLATTLVCWMIYKLTFARFAISKRWASLSIISISVALGLATTALSESMQFLSQELLLISLVVPGLITISLKNYGFKKVTAGTFTVTAAARDLPKLPLQFTYNIVGVDTSNKITSRANQQTYNGILERLNWKEVKAQLGQ